MSRFAFGVALACALPGVAWCAENPGAVKSIGVATMLQDGTILIGVGGPDATRAQAVLMVEPGDTNYQSIIDHVGGLKPGETKPIPPWPDQPPPAPRNDDSPPKSPPGA
ncbi:MAG TPA: hypothetical protein VNH44_05405 [Micropepsaceae bacterium]|nr:hypothetical protein [Micropepsaceae bacterium]